MMLDGDEQSPKHQSSLTIQLMARGINHTRKVDTMPNITKANIADYTITGEFDIAASIKPDRDSTETKTVTLRFRMVDEPIANVIASSLKDKRINWQVGGRAKFNEIKAGSVITVEYKGGRAPIDPVTSVLQMAAAAGVSVEDFLRAEMAKRAK